MESLREKITSLGSEVDQDLYIKKLISLDEKLSLTKIVGKVKEIDLISNTISVAVNDDGKTLNTKLSVEDYKNYNFNLNDDIVAIMQKSKNENSNFKLKTLINYDKSRLIEEERKGEL